MNATLARPLPLPPSAPAWRGRDGALVAAVLTAHLTAVWLATRPAAAPIGVAPLRVAARLIAAAPQPAPATTPATAPRPTPPHPSPATPPSAPAPAASNPAAAAMPAVAAPASESAASAAPAAAAASEPTPAAATPVLVNEGIEYLRPPAPVYPRAARQLGEQGRVVLKVLVDAGGQPRSVELAESSGYPRLDAAARAALADALFKPYRQGGRALPMWARVPIHFQLDR